MRRSNRKRKSVSSVSSVQEMSKGSGSKKKKCSPSQPAQPTSVPPATSATNQGKSMPRVPRSPQPGKDQEQTEKPPEKPRQEPPDFAALLIAMEARLSNKIEATNQAVKEAVVLSKTSGDALEALEAKVDSNKEALRETLARVEDQEERGQ